MDRQRHAAEIRAVDVSKNYGSFKALQKVDLVIGRGEFVTLLGPSGSGKTTFLMVLAGFERATSGKLLRDGIDITDHPPETRNFGMVFQGYALFPHMTVADNIAFALRVRRRPAADIRKRVGEMAERVGLQDHIAKKPAQLSGGQQQRVALARALSFEPDVLLLDEPFSALDKNLRQAMQTEMARLHRDLGTTFVFVTHDQGEALALSTHIAIFESGQLRQFGTPREVYDHPADRFTAEFLGEIELLKLFDCRREGDWIIGSFEGAAIAAPAMAGSGESAASQRAVVGIRPEYVRLRAAGSAVASNENAIPVRLAARTYLGARIRLDLACASDTRLAAEILTTDPLAACEIGAALLFTFSHADGRIVPHAADRN